MSSPKYIDVNWKFTPYNTDVFKIIEGTSTVVIIFNNVQIGQLQKMTIGDLENRTIKQLSAIS